MEHKKMEHKKMEHKKVNLPQIIDWSHVPPFFFSFSGFRQADHSSIYVDHFYDNQPIYLELSSL